MISHRVGAIAPLLLVSFASVASCGGSTSTSRGFSSFGPDSGGGGDGTGAGGGLAPSADAGIAANDSGGVDPADAACASVSQSAVTTPVNLYIMMDKSASLGGSGWQTAKDGLNAFLTDTASNGLRVGLNFFPRPADNTPACDQNAYKTPKVPFGVLPGNAQPILTAMANEIPDGSTTPIYVALGGALIGVSEVQTARPGEGGAVLLVTDGEPYGPSPKCGSVNPADIAEIENIAQAGLNTLKVPTYVIGLPGVSRTTVDRIAKAGGTDQAFVVLATNTQQMFEDALAQIRGKALPCEYQLPPAVASKQTAYDRVNVDLSTKGNPPATIGQSTDCAGDGWRYDDDKNPTKIVLCPATCQTLKSDYQAKIAIRLGCKTERAK